MKVARVTVKATTQGLTAGLCEEMQPEKLSIGAKSSGCHGDLGEEI